MFVANNRNTSRGLLSGLWFNVAYINSFASIQFSPGKNSVGERHKKRAKKRTIYLRRKSPVGIKVSNKIAIASKIYFCSRLLSGRKYNSQKYSPLRNNRIRRCLQIETPVIFLETTANWIGEEEVVNFHWFHVVIEEEKVKISPEVEDDLYVAGDSYLLWNDHLTALFALLLWGSSEML